MRRKPGCKWSVMIIVLAVFGLASAAGAHNPQKMDLAYDINSQTLAVKITHSSNTPDKHFVKEVVIKRNGVVIQRAVYTKQSGDTFAYTYKIPATAADTFEVTAICSIHGSLTEKLQPGV